jgi:DNA-binding CsgD family transcriptional regulator
VAVAESAGAQRAGRTSGDAALLDREAERAEIDQVLHTVRDGLSGTLVLRGAPGVGKSALLRYAVGAAKDLRVLTIAGLESEISRKFGGLHRLLAPFLSAVPDLPPPQRDALRIAFGEQAGTPPALFLVGLASLTVLSRAAEQQPLLCVVDDAQWIDPESAQVLGFVGRRLPADRVALGLVMVVGEPATTQEFTHLPAITVDGLPDAEARRLLGSVVEGRLNVQAVDRVLAETGDNPLALVELGRLHTADQLCDRATRPEPLPLGRRFATHFLPRVRDLSTDAQTFVLLAAADTESERAPLWRAAESVGIDPDTASAEAAWAGMLDLTDDSVRFRYPPARSAVYYGADAAELRRAHQALGEAGNQELRAWHRAAATSAPDEDLAAELQRTAERGSARGGYATRAALLRRSAELTPEDPARALREAMLAEATLIAGDPSRAQSVLEAALPRLTDAAGRGFAQSVQGAIRFAQGDAAEAARILAGAAREFEHDDRLARDAMLGALEAAIWSGPELTGEIARLARAFGPAAGPSPAISDLLLEGYSARFTFGYQASVAPLRAAVAALLAEDLDPAVGLRWFSLGAAAAFGLWDDRAAFDLADRWVDQARAAGAFTALPVALAFHEICDAMAQGRSSDAPGHGVPAGIGGYLAAVADVALPELIEAAVRAGHRQTAATAFETLSERTLLSGTPWGLGVRSRCEALLADADANANADADADADAERAYLESISQLKQSRMLVDLARTHLYYGRWLRRAKRRRDARRELHTARDLFAGIGADRFTEQAAAELRAVGERTGTRAAEKAPDLTPHEARIADLAASGASNSEIAANLSVSPSTVDYHLRKIFRKLDITSRTQLGARLTSRSAG